MEQEPMGGSPPADAMSPAEAMPPATEPPPPVSWEAPRQEMPGGGGGGSFWGGKPPSQLTLQDAFMTALKIVQRPSFVIPILVIGVVVNLVVIAAIVPLLVVIAAIVPLSVGLDAGSSSAAFIAQFRLIIFVGVIDAIVVGVILNLYGLIWAVTASKGAEPTMNEAFAIIGRRWIDVLGSGLIVGAITFGLFIVVGLVSALLGAIGIVVLIAGVIVIAYVGVRLSMSTWLAADGAAAVASVQNSWRLTQGKLLLILGWGFAFAIVFGIIGAVLGAVLGLIPLIGPALAQTVPAAFGFGAGVTLFRRVLGS